MIGALTLGSFIVLLLTGLPLFFSLCLAAMLGATLLQGTNISVISLQIFQGLNSFPLVAIPLFLLMARLMEVGGVTTALVRFATSLAGRLRGAMALGNVGASTLLAGVTGSSLADTTAIGSIMIPAMIDEGYPAPFAGAVTAAANIVGPIIPPSTLVIIYGFASGASINALFLAGLLPGLLLSLSFGVLTYTLCVRNGYGRQLDRFDPRASLGYFVQALPAMVIPALIVVGVIGGVFTVSESAGGAAFYALLYAVGAGWWRDRSVPWRRIAGAFRSAAIDTGVVIIMVGASNLLSWVLARSQLPQTVATMLMGLGRVETLALINLILLVFGMFLEPLPAVLLACSILLPLVQAAGIDLIHFGIMMIVNLQIGVIMPPHGSSALICSRMAGIPFETQIRGLLPFILMGVATVLLVTYIPFLTLWLPSLLPG